jgi:anti-sigma regulatory factor (Ser/Thr protein kinase)
MDKIIKIANPINLHQAEIAAKKLAEGLSFGKKQCEEIRVIASELASNILKHAGEGTIQIKTNNEHIEIISKNQGSLTEEDFIDERSSKGTLGIGLGAVGRLADEVSYKNFDGWVEIEVIKFCNPSPKKVEIAALSYGVMGDKANGDDYVSVRKSNSLFLALIDVLGHGKNAHEVALEVKNFLKNQHYMRVNDLIDSLHARLRSKIGAMVEIMKLDLKEGMFEFCGVGDVSCRIYKEFDKRSMALLTTDGIVGELLHKISVHRLELPEKYIIAMFSDGISQSFDIPIELRKLSPVSLVCKLMKKYGKSHDDRTLLIAKI